MNIFSAQAGGYSRNNPKLSKELKTMEKTEYQIPGMPNLGTVERRNALNPQGIEKVFREYTNGNGMLIDTTGKPSPVSAGVPTDANGNPLPFSELRNIRTSMGA